MFCGSFSLLTFLVVHVVFKSIHAVVACFAEVFLPYVSAGFSFRSGMVCSVQSGAIGVAYWRDAVKFYHGD